LFTADAIPIDVVHGSSLTAKSKHPSPLTEELSPCELRVLRYLPTNLSRPEIASELSVSVNTVNTNVRNICPKLQLRDRSSAVLAWSSPGPGAVGLDLLGCADSNHNANHGNQVDSRSP
jgi:DNA-binding NarL/FixJ family response regulator